MEACKSATVTFLRTVVTLGQLQHKGVFLKLCDRSGSGRGLQDRDEVYQG